MQQHQNANESLGVQILNTPEQHVGGDLEAAAALGGGISSSRHRWRDRCCCHGPLSGGVPLEGSCRLSPLGPLQHATETRCDETTHQRRHSKAVVAQRPRSKAERGEPPPLVTCRETLLHGPPGCAA
jgi:hypothetical protein